MPNINGYRLFELRDKSGYSQDDIAHMLGVTRQAVQRWEAGKSQPPSKRLMKLSKIYGVSVDYLLGNDTDKQTDAPITDQKQQTLSGDNASDNGNKAAEIVATTERQIFVVPASETKPHKAKRLKALLICLIVITSIIAVFSAIIGFSLFTSNQGGYATTHTFDLVNPLLLLFIGLVVIMAILVIIIICVALKRKNK